MSTLTSDSNAATFDLSLLRCAAGTDVGMRREENQDSFGVIKREDFQAFFVADGMGGAQGGATASRMTISLLQQKLAAEDIRITPDFITSSLKDINQRIFDKGCAEAAYAGMGTTLVGLVFSASGVFSVNIGDSRAYRVRHQNIDQISKDHTLLSELIQTGTLAPQEAHEHPISHMLTRSLGPVAEVEVECHVLPESPEVGDIYLLCSDGLYNYVPAEEMLSVVRSNPLDDANQILINLANQRGGGDNITVLVIAVGEKSPRGRKPTLPFPSADAGEDVSDQEATLTEENNYDNQSSIVVPPPVEEPRDFKEQRRALRMRQRSYVGTPRVMPTIILLGSTLIIGLVLGGFIRRVSIDGIGDLNFGGSGESRTESGRQLGSSLGSPSGNSLSALARQIRAEGGTTQPESTQVDPQLIRSPEQIKNAIERLEQQISVLNATPANTMAGTVDEIRSEVDRLQREYSAIEANLDVASRAVTLWLSRQLAFENQSAGTESPKDIEQVAAYSSQLKDKLAALSALSYQYRSKADQVELYPGNSVLRSDLDILQAKREQLRRELQTDVRKALGNILASAYKDYETIKIRRDILWLDLQAAKRELDIQSALSDGNPEKKLQLLQSLRERLLIEQQALSDSARLIR